MKLWAPTYNWIRGLHLVATPVCFPNLRTHASPWPAPGRIPQGHLGIRAMVDLHAPEYHRRHSQQSSGNWWMLVVWGPVVWIPHGSPYYERIGILRGYPDSNRIPKHLGANRRDLRFPGQSLHLLKISRKFSIASFQMDPLKVYFWKSNMIFQLGM